MLVFISIPLAGILILFGLLLVWSIPGKPLPHLGEDGNPLAGSISEKIWVDINGQQQGMIIKSKNEDNPVLLFLHGGPGMPEYFLTANYPTGLEEDFTMVWWDRRGAGLSYHPDIPLETMTLEQSIQDTLAVTNYLRERFGKEKIYLMAHSGGSFIGLQAAARSPELFHAYIGMGQMTYQLKSEQMASEYMIQQLSEGGNPRLLRTLQNNPVSLTVPLPKDYTAVRDSAMHSLGIGTTREMRSVISGIFLPSLQFREYTLGEKINLWRGKIFSHANQWNEMITTDLTQKVTRVDIPVYFFHGEYDLTCNYSLVNDYFTILQAPLKGFYTFSNSAHSPIFEEPERMRQILLQDVIKAQTTLADH